MLTEKQQRFADLMGTPGITAAEAYRSAGYKAKGHAAEVNASRLLKNAEVQAAIEARRQQAAKAIGVTSERVVLELARLAFSDKRKLFRADGSIKPPDEWDDDTAATIAGIETDELNEGSGEKRVRIGDRRKVKQWDKVKALELLGKHLGMFVDRHEHSGPGGKPIENNVNVNPIDRSEQLAAVFAMAMGIENKVATPVVSRETPATGGGEPPSDSTGKSVDSGSNKKRPDAQAS